MRACVLASRAPTTPSADLESWSLVCLPRQASVPISERHRTPPTHSRAQHWPPRPPAIPLAHTNSHHSRALPARCCSAAPPTQRQINVLTSSIRTSTPCVSQAQSPATRGSNSAHPTNGPYSCSNICVFRRHTQTFGKPMRFGGGGGSFIHIASHMPSVTKQRPSLIANGWERDERKKTTTRHDAVASPRACTLTQGNCVVVILYGPSFSSRNHALIFASSRITILVLEDRETSTQKPQLDFFSRIRLPPSTSMRDGVGGVAWHCSAGVSACALAAPSLPGIPAQSAHHHRQPEAIREVKTNTETNTPIHARLFSATKPSS